MKTLILSHAAKKSLDALPDAPREQISEALINYAVDGRGDVIKLTGQDMYRMRVGRYRVIFDEDTITILAISIGKRDTTTYKRH